MAYIPKRVLLGQFPKDGLLGVHADEALDLAIEGELYAYYQIPVPFHLHGDHDPSAPHMGIDYGTYHGPLARLTAGMLVQLQAHGNIKFDKTQAVQVLGFESNDFGPQFDDINIREAFQKERCFWLVLKDADELVLSIDRVIFLRDDIEALAAKRNSVSSPHPDFELEELRQELEGERANRSRLEAEVAKLKAREQLSMEISKTAQEFCEYRLHELEQVDAAREAAEAEAKALRIELELEHAQAKPSHLLAIAGLLELLLDNSRPRYTQGSAAEKIEENGWKGASESALTKLFAKARATAADANKAAQAKAEAREIASSKAKSMNP